MFAKNQKTERVETALFPLNHHCRICLKNNLCLSTFFELIGRKYLPSVVYNISGVKILRKLEPGAQICRHCRKAVLIAENIIFQCQESDEYIQNEKLRDNRTENDAESKTVSRIAANDPDSPDDTAEEDSITHESECNIASPKIDNTNNRKESTKSNEASTKKPNDSLLTCDNCDFNCKTARGLVKHRSEAHQIEDDNIFPCRLCDKRFPWKSTLNRHIQNYHKTLPEEKKFDCLKCGKIYTLKNHLIEHQKQRHGPRRFRCVEPNCKQTFTRAFTLRRHFLTAHQNNSRYHCIDCNEYFKVYDHWKYHNKIVHNNQKRDFKYYKS